VGQRFVRECLRDWAEPIIAAKVPPGYTPRTLSVDEYSLRKGRRYETLVCDAEKRQVLASLPGRDGVALQEWLEKREDPWAVEAAVIDMSLTYREVIELCLPKAKVVADRFHVVRRVGLALDQVRLRLQRARGEEHDGELYELRHVLMTDRAKWSVEERRRVRQLFRELPELRRAWLLREQFRRWYEAKDRATAEKLLAKWEGRVQASGIPEFVRLSAGANSMLVEWREPILNYFDVRLTNGFAEGKNNRTKAIQRQAYGYTNPANLRLRILLPKLE
jgi:transposase